MDSVTGFIFIILLTITLIALFITISENNYFSDFSKDMGPAIIFIFIVLLTIIFIALFIKIPKNDHSSNFSKKTPHCSTDEYKNLPYSKYKYMPGPNFTTRTFSLGQKNSANFQLVINEVIEIRSSEKPSTGYIWDLTSSVGLNMIETTFAPSKATDNSEWVRSHIFQAVSKGDQTITGVYKRPKEDTTDNHFKFNLNVKVV